MLLPLLCRSPHTDACVRLRCAGGGEHCTGARRRERRGGAAAGAPRDPGEQLCRSRFFATVSRRHMRALGLQNEEKAVAQARQVQSEGAK